MKISMKNACQLLIALIGLASGSAVAQTGYGLRAGADPDQFHFGGHFISEPLIPHLSFQPNLEIGVGNHVTTVAANFEFTYRIPIANRNASAYVGAGPALNLYRFGDFSNRSDDSEVGGGFNVLLGMEHKDGLFGEIKVGAIDSPEFKFTIGFTFR